MEEILLNSLESIRQNADDGKKAIQKIKNIDGINAESAIIVDLPNGEKGLACSIHYFDHPGEECVQIFDANGNHIKSLIEPEYNRGYPVRTRLCKDDEYLYVLAENCPTPFMARYKMGTFECDWKREIKSPTSFIANIAATDDKIVFYCANSKGIRQVDKSTGEELELLCHLNWEIGHGQQAHRAVAVHGGKILTATIDAECSLIDVDVQTGAIEKQASNSTSISLANNNSRATSNATIGSVAIDPENQII